jgi:hypothetical protein
MEWLLGGLVADKLHCPEEATAADIPNVRVCAETLPEEPLQIGALGLDVIEKLLGSYDALDLKCGCTYYRVVLVRVPVGKSLALSLHYVGNSLPD